MPTAPTVETLMTHGVEKILQLLPDRVGRFEGSEYPLPVKTALWGEGDLDLPALRSELLRRQEGDVKDLLEPLLLAAELCEADQPDRHRFFVADRELQSYVFTGSKWRAGWVLVLGGQDQAELIQQLKARQLMVFTDQPDVPDAHYIGSRDTSPIYFLQMMVRYGLVWGRIRAGDGHELGHFLKKDLPGCMIICADLPPLKYLCALGLMKLGAPAAVPRSFPFPYGTRVVADDIPHMVEESLRFPNLRLRYFRDEIISLPGFCNTAYANEVLDARHRLGGDPDSFFCLRPAPCEGRAVEVVGSPGGGGVGIVVEVYHPDLTDDLAPIVESVALKAVNYISGVQAEEVDGSLRLSSLAEPAALGEKIGAAIYWGIRLQYPRLERIRVRLVYDRAVLAVEAAAVREYKAARRRAIASMTEENTPEYCACTECRPFSLGHTCIITPDRKPMCASRTYFSTKANAYFGLTRVPYQRQSEKDLPLKMVFDRGAVLDPVRGEYEGCNRIYSELTQGQLNRVFLHSLRGHPHTSCGCFQNLAFWIDEVRGIGIMSRNSTAVSPDGRTWDILANHAGGKQTDGITGVSLAYIRSRQFLQGDGGIGNVVWVDSKLHPRIRDLFRPGQRVPTEEGVTDLAGLKQYLAGPGPG
ncbi:MAG: hypothetical protein Q8P31_03320 [Bacillota bacterium]|nr:hypothetical protein [Bacillota bacterium]